MKKNTAVSIVTGVCVDNRGIVFRFFAEVGDFFLFSEMSTAVGRENDGLSHTKLMLRMRETILPLFHMPLWHARGQIYININRRETAAMSSNT